MVTDRDKEKESELESSMYTNCLLLGLDPTVLGGARSGLFRRSNPKMGEQLLYFLLSSLRGPKDFEKVWPIFDSAQSRDFRKIVQAIITELESQGALPRSNSRVSSLATCCGPRFVELLWQLSVHVLREVHRRSFPADVAANQLPAPLTDVSYLHAASLLPVSKARIALERKKFLKNANTAVHRQAMQSELAQEMTAQFRVLCAEQAYLQQEMEKLQDLRNKAKLEAELWDDCVPSSSSQTTHMVSKATRMWESLLACKSQHEVLASGPIEDLVAHREHRYRISGYSLLAAMESSSPAPQWDNSSVLPGDMTSRVDGLGQIDLPHSQGSSDSLSRADDRSGRLPQTVDVAEVLRRWTHALQRIHKQSLYMAKANDGEGPELLRVASEAGSGGHAETLTVTLAEHRQHLVSIEGLINQLKEAVPAMQKSILDLTDEVNTLTSNTPVNDYEGRLPSSIQGQSSGRAHEHGSDEISEMTSKLSSVQLDKSSSSPAMKLPHLFSLTPNLSGKGATTKKNAISTQTSHVGSFTTRNMDDHPLSGDGVRNNDQGDDYHIQNLRHAVRQVALTRPSNNEESSHISRQDNSYDGSQHFFMPLSTVEVSHKDADTTLSREKQDLDSSHGISLKNTRSDRFVSHFAQMSDEVPNISSNDGAGHGNGVNGHSTPNGLDTSIKRPHLDFDKGLDQVFSPPLLMDSSFFADAYEDLLAPLSETDAALMEQREDGYDASLTTDANMDGAIPCNILVAATRMA